MHLDDPVPTPYVVVDPVLVDGAIVRMQEQVSGVGMALRPHAKTHKSLEIAHRQLAAGAIGLTVATVSEAEVFAAICDDLFIAYPLWVDEARATRLRHLLEGTRVSVGVSSVESVRRLAPLASAGLRVLVEVDPGMGRSGVPAAEVGPIAAAAVDAGLPLDGVFAFPGHAYVPDGRAAAAADEARELWRARESLAAVGLPAPVVSGGSTPSMSHADAAVLTECRPGVYVFGDAQQWELGSTDPSQIALSVVATVVARFADRVILDAGSKILGADRLPWATGFGRLLDVPEARIAALSEHHATVTGFQAPVGTRVRIAPNHVCTVVNLVDRLHVLGPYAPWLVDARGCNT